MNRNKVVKVVCDSIQAAKETIGAEGYKEFNTLSEDTQLLGKNAILDSLALVVVIVEIEQVLLGEGIEITLTNEKAMSMTRSPFRSVKSLTDYICEEIK